MTNPPLISYDELVRRIGAPAVAVVFGVGHFQGLAVLRGLGRMGVPVCAIGEANSVGFYSRYACESHVSPDPHKDPEGLMKLLFDLGKRLKTEGKRAVLFPTRDSVVELLSQRQDELSEFFICHVPPFEIIRDCSDKEAQIRAARELNVPAPRTYFDSELDNLYRDLDAGHLAFPFILKPKKELPAHLKKRFRVVVIENRTQLAELVQTVAYEKIRFLIQEIIPGGDDELYTLGSCMGRDGELKACFTGRKLRQQPPKFGVCRVGESKLVEPLIEDGAKLLRGLKFFGVSQVETKRDPRDGKYKLMEVNPRPWAWIGLPIALGINIPYAHFCDALGIPAAQQNMTDTRGVWISLSDDLFWSLTARDGRPWQHCFAGYDKIVEAYYAKDDRKPGLIHFKRASIELSRAFAGSLLRKFGLKRKRVPPR